MESIIGFEIVLILGLFFGFLFKSKSKKKYLVNFAVLLCTSAVLSNLAFPIYGMIFGFGSYCSFSIILASGILKDFTTVN